MSRGALVAALALAALLLGAGWAQQGARDSAQDLGALSEQQLVQMLRDVRGPEPLNLPVPPWKWAALAAAAALLAALAALGLARMLRTPTPAPVATAPLEPTARERALRELEELRQRRLWEQGRYVELSDELSAILKRFVARSAIAHAENLTTTELARALGGRWREEVRRLEEILRACDAAKFARQQRFAANPIDLARQFVLSSSAESGGEGQ